MADDRSERGSRLDRVGRFLQREGTRILVGIAGGAVVLAGLVLLPLPGPGLLVVLAGLAILATQFEWAQDLLERVRARARQAFDRLLGHDPDPSEDHPPADAARPDPTVGECSDVA